MQYCSRYLKHHFVLKDVWVSTLLIVMSPLWGQLYANRTFDPSLYLSDSSQVIQKQHKVCENKTLKDTLLFQRSIHECTFRPGSNGGSPALRLIHVTGKGAPWREHATQIVLISYEQHIWIVNTFFQYNWPKEMYNNPTDGNVRSSESYS